MSEDRLGRSERGDAELGVAAVKPGLDQQEEQDRDHQDQGEAELCRDRRRSLTVIVNAALPAEGG